MDRVAKQTEVIDVSDPAQCFDKPDVVRAAVWKKVFDVVSAESYSGTRELIKKLEEARERDGCGPA